MRSAIRLVLAIITLLLVSEHATAQELGDYSDRPVTLTEEGSTTIGKTNVRTFGVTDVEGSFDGVVLRIRMPATERSAWVRFNYQGTVGEWEPMHLLQDASNPIFLAAYHGEAVESGGGFEIALMPSGAPIQILSAGVFDTREDDDSQQSDWDPGLSKKANVSGNIVPPHLHTRSEWGAAPFIGSPEALARPSYDRMTFHHAACCGAYTLAEGLTQVKAIQDFHQNGRGWSDIGYHFLLDQSGRVYQGRPFLDDVSFEEGPTLALGAHVGGFNTGNIGVSVLGCYHPPEGNSCTDMLSPAALDSLITLFAYLSETYGVSPSTLRGHRDFGSTACPGDNNYQLLPTIRRRVAELLETGNQPIGTASIAAVVYEDGVVGLDWQFLTDLGITGFTIERVTAGGREVLFEGDTPLDMSLTDVDVAVPGEVRYVLSASDATGRSQALASARVEIDHPSGFSLSNGFPNPFSDRTTIRYYLTQDGFVTLRVFDAAGRLVDVLRNSFQEKDRWYTSRFEARDRAPGSYFYQISVEGFAGVVFSESGTIVLVR